MQGCLRLDHWYRFTLYKVFALIWTRFLSDTFTVFNVVFRGQCFCIWLFVVYTFCWYFCLLCFHICSIILFLRIFSTAIFMMLLCLLISLGSMWFLWLNVSVIDNFMFVTDVADFSVFVYVADVSDLYFITLYLKRFILFWCHFFTFNQDYLTVFFMTYVLVTVIYLVC